MEYNENLEEQDIQEEEMLNAQTDYGYPQRQDKASLFAFLKRVIFMSDTSRTSNLSEEELGMTRVPVRTNQMISLFCNQMGLEGLGHYFFAESQILTNTALSRGGFLDKLAITQSKRTEESLKTNIPQKKGWFAKKEEQPHQIGI